MYLQPETKTRLIALLTVALLLLSGCIIPLFRYGLPAEVHKMKLYEVNNI